MRKPTIAASRLLLVVLGLALAMLGQAFTSAPDNGGFVGNPKAFDLNRAFYATSPVAPAEAPVYTLPAVKLQATGTGTTPAPFAMSAAYYFNVCHKTSDLVILTQLGTLHDVAGVKGFNLQLKAFAGAPVTGKEAIGGFALGFDWMAAKEVSVFIAAAGNASTTGKLSFGVLTGISVKF